MITHRILGSFWFQGNDRRCSQFRDNDSTSGENTRPSRRRRSHPRWGSFFRKNWKVSVSKKTDSDTMFWRVINCIETIKKLVMASEFEIWKRLRLLIISNQFFFLNSDRFIQVVVVWLISVVLPLNEVSYFITDNKWLKAQSPGEVFPMSVVFTLL